MKDNELKIVETYISFKDYIELEDDIKKDIVLHGIDNKSQLYQYIETLDSKYIVVKEIPTYSSNEVAYLIKTIDELCIRCRITSYNEVKRKCKFMEQTTIKFNNKD
ncbi:hypothetical protein KNV44_gp55 [uncultured phage cr127_1]|uniref:Uncharacterized protein n=1 Tax=uncultured phage cr127_1 TaxID=2772077 RepID=A0A7M1S2W4_9CAUD|nr:hypothetical protein KNV44_gp55 [uncultured phage cr127_1]QOR59780.1 hypothetical protein [uncultured phage cr127_1]